jgi:hypothetical protein
MHVYVFAIGMDDGVSAGTFAKKLKTIWTGIKNTNWKKNVVCQNVLFFNFCTFFSAVVNQIRFSTASRYHCILIYSTLRSYTKNICRPYKMYRYYSPLALILINRKMLKVKSVFDPPMSIL